jgi:hypothetical protein
MLTNTRIQLPQIRLLPLLPNKTHIADVPLPSGALAPALALLREQVTSMTMTPVTTIIGIVQARVDFSPE